MTNSNIHKSNVDAGARSISSCLTTEQVVGMLDSDEELTLSEEEYNVDEVFFPGSDDELGFEEVEIGDKSDDESVQGEEEEDVR